MAANSEERIAELGKLLKKERFKPTGLYSMKPTGNHLTN